MKIPEVGRFFIFFVLDLVKDPLKTITEQQKKYGDIFWKKMLGQPYFFICHPKLAEQVLSKNQENYLKHPNLAKNIGPIVGEDNLIVTNNRAQWHHDRQLAHTAFETSVFFERYAGQIIKQCAATLDQWGKKTDEKSSPILVGPEIDRMVLENIRTTLFDNIDLDVEAMLQHIPKIFSMAIQRATSINKLLWILPTKRKKLFQREIDFFQNELTKVFNSRLKQGRDVDDVLGTFMHDAQMKDMGNSRCKAIGSQVMTFNIVGFTTTSSALKWILVMLMLYPKVEKKIEEELLEICKANQPNYADYANLKYTRAFICEVLRLYPPIPVVFRESINPDSLQEYPIPAHVGIMVSIFHIHRHKDYWKEPEEFNPDRFLSNLYGQDEPSAYIPFGAGKRSCLGKNFALMELTLITAMIVQKFHIVKPENFQIEIEYIASMFIRPKLGAIRLKRK